jgi:hypothetical protein
VQRITTMFGMLIRDSGLLFEPAAIDPGGIVLLVFGSIGVALVLRSWRRPDGRFTIAVLQIVSVVFILRMQRVYNYHFEIVVLIHLRKHQRLSAQYSGRGRIGLMLVPGQDVTLFRQPPLGTTLEASYYRNAHIPEFGVRFDAE